MVYEWGTKPEIETYETVSDSYEFKEGEYGGISNFHWATPVSIIVGEKDFANIIKSKLKEKGVSEVLYIRVHRETAGIFNHYIVEECYFKGSPFTGAEWILIIGSLTVLTVVLTLVGLGAFLLIEVKKLGPVVATGVGLVLVIIACVFLLLILGVGFQYKGKKRTIKAGK